jgi:D-glycero-D-manno-heptose 1,7-bisphosphate phosphatase
VTIALDQNTPAAGIHWRVAEPGSASRPGLILDRDGVLVDFVDYLHRPDQTRVADGAVELISAMNGVGAVVGVVTNQAGIARSLYQWSDYFKVEREIDRQLSEQGAALHGVVACPYHPDFTEGWSNDYSYWRKPGPGMIDLLVGKLNITRERCWMIGDHLSDVGAARAAGLPGAMLVKRGWGGTYEQQALELAGPTFEVVVIEEITQALPFLVDRMKLSQTCNGPTDSGEVETLKAST